MFIFRPQSIVRGRCWARSWVLAEKRGCVWHALAFAWRGRYGRAGG